MRSTATVLHLDLDAFFAAVEQRDKPSLRGKPVIVGGLGQRGVVSTASYEARAFGVHSAMPMHEARRLCPHAAFLWGRFGAYRAASAIVMGLLRELSPLVEQLSVDEAFVDLAVAADGASPPAPDPGSLIAVAEDLRARLSGATGGLTASVGLGSSKFMAKVASELAKPDGVRLIEPGSEVAVIAELPARAIPGVGPVTMERLAKLGVRTIGDLQRLDRAEVVRELGSASGAAVYALAFAEDDRAVVPERETKSISIEDTFEHDLTDRDQLAHLVRHDAGELANRLHHQHLFARTITLKAKYPDFTSLTRSRTLNGATDRAEVITRVALGLLDGIDLRPGVRLLGVGVAGFSELAQEALFDDDLDVGAVRDETEPGQRPAHFLREGPRWVPGQDVVHEELGAGWVWGSGVGRVTVRFETAQSGPGPIRTFAEDDPQLQASERVEEP